MPTDPLPHYTFLPWARRGIAASIDQTDALAAAPPATPKARATVTAEITVEAEPMPGQPTAGATVVKQTVAIVGPGDIKAFQPGAILRRSPVPGTVNASAGDLAFVEFYDEDFPWRYTPAKATTGHKLRPWIALLVLAEGEYTLLNRPGDTSILVVDVAAALPPAAETWAWAHVQVSGDLAAVVDLDDFVTTSPDHALARLLSPRKLVPQHSYRAFVVPAFESGRLAGLGSSAENVPAQQSSWGAGQPARFPVYADWAFRTSEAADFEVLARRPKPLVVGEEFGKRAMDVSRPGAGLPAVAGADVDLEGALQPIHMPRVDFPEAPGAAMAAALEHVVDLGAEQRTATPSQDPVISPPAYGAAPVGMTRIGDVAVVPGTSWLGELNKDPRNRAAAGLGAEIVRQRDEELMDRSWAQVDELNAVNQRLREADLAMAASDRIFAKHVRPSNPDRMLRITAAVHSTIAVHGAVTVRGEINQSLVPAAAQAPAFRRIARPQRRFVALVAGTPTGGLQSGLVSRMNHEPTDALALSTAPPMPEPAAFVALATVVQAAEAAKVQQATQPDRPRDQYLSIVHADAEARGAGLSPVTTAAAVAGLRQSLTTRLDAAVPPDPSNADTTGLRDGVAALIVATLALEVPVAGQAIFRVEPAAFAAAFGEGVDGKAYSGVTVAPQGSMLTSIATTTDAATTQAFVTALTAFTVSADERPALPTLDPLADPPALAGSLAARMQPRTALPARLLTVLGGVGDDVTAELARSRRIKPVLAHPRFDDPLFASLRSLSQDYVLPNISDLPPETIAVMEPNARFIESLLAGASTEMAKELLWNEFPTDLRGTYFPRFWDARDAGVPDPPADILDLHEWSGDLGSNGRRTGGLLVLVVRAELLVKFPNTIVFAQQARFVGIGPGRSRTVDDAGTVHYPVLRGHLDPDIELYGFEITPGDAAGSATDAGYFFCFMERPGQSRFGLDLEVATTSSGLPVAGLQTWNDLAWPHLLPADAQHVVIAGNTALQPTTPDLPDWGETSAHMASILCQNPVLLARHATDMLPPGLHA